MAIDFGSLASDIIGFLLSNWVAIVTIVITIIGVLGTPYYLRSRINSARQERYNQAKSTLLDVLENQIINGRDLTEERINNFISAVERRYSVSISDRISSVGLLQDLQFRLEESKLDVTDKESFSSQIDDLIKQYREERHFEDLPFEYQMAIEELETVEDVSAEDIVSELEAARSKRQTTSIDSPFQVFMDTSRVMLNPSVLFELPADTRSRILRVVLGTVLIYLSILYYFFIFLS